MYRFAQVTMKLDGVITEFCDIYSPISQILKNTTALSNENNNWKFQQQIRVEE
jgi:hypothetical protein